MDFGIIECPVDRVPCLLRREGVSLGQWHAHEHPRVEAEVEVHAGETCCGPHVGDGCRRSDAARAGEEARDLARSDRQDRHTSRLEVFDRRSNVEDRLGTSAYDDDGSPRELLEVGRDVERRRWAPERAAMDAPDPAGREDLNPDGTRGHHRRRDGRAGPAGRGQRCRECRPGCLRDGPGCRRRKLLELVAAESEQELPVVDRDGRPYCAALTNGRFGPGRNLEVVRIWEAMRDEGRFERNDGTAASQGVGHLLPQHDAVAERLPIAQRMRPTQRRTSSGRGPVR